MEMKEKFDSFWRKMDIHRNNAFSVTAMEAAFRYGDEWLDQLLRYLEGNFLFIRDYCAENIPLVKPNVPDATYLVWLDCRALGLDGPALREFMALRPPVERCSPEYSTSPASISSFRF